MAARDVLKNINVFVDGRGYAGQVDEFNPPKLTLKLEEYRAGGMDLPTEIPLGMEKLEADFSMIAYDRNLLASFGVSVGQVIPFVLRGALESFDGTVTAVTHTMYGAIKELDPGSWKGGDKPSLKVSLKLDYYKLEHGGLVVHEIDVINMIRVINGTDQLAQTRAALGL